MYSEHSDPDLAHEPLLLLERWLGDARTADLPEPSAAAFITVGEGSRPSARTVSLKRLQDDALIFTSALWTRKAREIELNPNVALLSHWPAIGRQVHIAGDAAFAERALAVELFSERELSHRIQTIVSRQGEPIEDLEPLRARHAHLMAAQEAPPECPPDWGAIRVLPHALEFWSQAPDRLHDRMLYRAPRRRLVTHAPVALSAETRLPIGSPPESSRCNRPWQHNQRAPTPPSPRSPPPSAWPLTPPSSPSRSSASGRCPRSCGRSCSRRACSDCACLGRWAACRPSRPK